MFIQLFILQMEQMEEEYESRLNKTVRSSNGDTPSKNMQLKVKFNYYFYHVESFKYIYIFIKI